jgi:predicted amidohydrolase YtcJ
MLLSQSPRMADDRTVVLRGGTVRTLDPAHPTAAALVVRGDRIAAVLDRDDDAPAGALVVDLGGACVLPGFTDAHVHFPSWALARRELHLLGARSLAEAVDRVARAAADAPHGTWLRGRGWRDELWPAGEAPSREALDAVTRGLPVALRAHDGHSLWLNSAGLAWAGGDLDTPGGVVERDADGEPTGILREEAAWRFEARAEPSRPETLQAMREALPAAAAAGAVAIHDKDGGRHAPELFAALRDEDALTLRVWQSLPAERLGDDDVAPEGAPGALLRVGYVKAFMDGTLGSRTARLLDGSGVEITSGAALAEIVRRASAAGFSVAVHAIGDRANREALDAFAATREDWRPRGLRPRIEHAQCVHPDDVPRFAALGVAASVQYTHATSDRDIADRLWGERAASAYPYRSLLAAGARLAGGSDAPVEELDPLAGLRAAVRRSADDRPAWRPEESIDAESALASFTTAPAWLAGEEDVRGRLAAGRLADLVVLDRDPLEDLDGARVLGAMLAGAWTLTPPGSA